MFFMVVQQQKSVRSVGGNSPVRSAKIFKFRRFRCKNAPDSPQTLSAREDETYMVFGASKSSFHDYGDAMQWSSSWLLGCVKSSRNARCLTTRYPSKQMNYIYDNYSAPNMGLYRLSAMKKVNKKTSKCGKTRDMFGHVYGQFSTRMVNCLKEKSFLCLLRELCVS